ncbi:hypothetical protein KJ865_12885, partial [Myxococcota bacterium]|nr:hypothetical protein [Myxococcota bacterium]
YGSGLRAQRQRASLAHEIMARAEFRIVEISAARIDAFVLRKGGLNLLEQMTAAMIIRLLGPSIPVAADGETLFSPLNKEFPSLVAANKADSLFPAVSAASILAKHARDQWFHQYQTRMLTAFGLEVSGGGYVNHRTDSFIEAFQKKYRSPPPHLRVSWKRKSKTMDLLFD